MLPNLSSNLLHDIYLCQEIQHKTSCNCQWVKDYYFCWWPKFTSQT